MRIKKQKPQEFAVPPSSHFSGHSFGRAIILIDDNPARVSASEELTKLYKSYSRHLSDLTRHETHVRPSYYQWLAGLFAEQISRVQRLQADLVQKSYLLQRMRNLCIFEGFSLSHAFEQAHEDLRLEEEDAEESDSFHEEESDASGDDSEETIDESLFEELEREFANSRRQRDAETREDARNREANLESKTKSFYRKLAHALHPDLSGEQTELDRELWEETQAAYKKRDLDQLQLIWTLVSIQKGATRGESISRDVRLFDLRAAAAHLKEKLRLVKKEKRRLSREDPSWAFEKKNKQEFAADVRSELDREENLLSSALDEIEEDLEVFAKSSGRKRKRPDKEQMPFGF